MVNFLEKEALFWRKKYQKLVKIVVFLVIFNVLVYIFLIYREFVGTRAIEEVCDIGKIEVEMGQSNEIFCKEYRIVRRKDGFFIERR